MELEGALEILLASGCQHADVYAETSERFLVTLEEGRLSRVVSGVERGVGLRVVSGLRTSYAHTNDPTPARLAALARETASRATGGGEPISVADGTVASPPTPADSLETDRRIALVRLADRAARAVHPSIRQVQVTLSERVQEVTILAPGRRAQGTRFETFMAVQAVASDGTVLERGYETEGRSEGSAFLDEAAVERLATTAASRAVRLIAAGPAPAGTMPVVMSAEAGGTMVHEAIGHGLENDLAGQGFSVYSGRVGQRVASPLVSVVDDPTLPGRRGSYLFDDEGIPSRRTVLVENGTLAGFISDILSAARFGGKTTGNGRRQSFRHVPIPRMSNTLILPGTAEPEEIVRDTKRGVLVTRMGGGQVNTVNGDFVFEVSEGFLIENGRTGPMVRGALLIGNGPAALADVDAVGSDLGFAVGTCGKEGQGVPVADAQPTLRIPALTVGGRVQ